MLGDPIVILQIHNGHRSQAPHAYYIFKINFANEANRLGFYDRILIDCEASLYWARATFQQRQHYCRLANVVLGLHYQRNAYNSRNISRSFHVVLPTRLLMTNNNHATLPNPTLNVIPIPPTRSLPHGQPIQQNQNPPGRNNNNQNNLSSSTNNTLGDDINNGFAFIGDNGFDMCSLDPWAN
ncbi:7086_t:CDS:1 [Funneliformis geosporum]|uniref:13301_t:CDS:1 n=1 Tax=Funneliformis geosporum TaxID=1117311 RepID=A0A9W4SAJ5_9GLOM|nr:7086_t:CDS:1 [Funneliformis geosporum]CAI2162779.1 13301_t:CDS:1 [Funneliformis geosporum]